MTRGQAQNAQCRIDRKLTDQAREWLRVDAALVGQVRGGSWLLFQEGMPPLPLGNSSAKATDAIWRLAQGIAPISQVQPAVRVESVVTPSVIKVSVTHLETGEQRTVTARPGVASRDVLEEVLMAQLAGKADAVA